MEKNYDETFRCDCIVGAGAVDFASYTGYVKRLEKHIDPAGVNPAVLDALLSSAVAAGDLLDLYKKLIVYGQQEMTKKLLEANTRIRHANIAADDALVMSTFMEPPPAKHQVNLRLLHAAIGLFGEAAELLRALQKQAETGELDAVNVEEELGDLAFYFAQAHDAVDLPVYRVLGRNKAKLDVRFGGAWSKEAVMNRNLEAERAALTGQG